MQPYVTAAEWLRFWSHVRVIDDPDACWEWTGYRLPAGYGMVTVRKRRMLATRWLWEAMWHVRLRRTEYVLHRCNNPACVRPEHLRVDTQGANVQQSWDEGRHPPPAHSLPEWWRRKRSPA